MVDTNKAFGDVDKASHTALRWKLVPVKIGTELA